VGSLCGGTKEEIIRLQSDILQLQNQVLELQKGLDRSNGTTQTLLEQLNDQFATTNRTIQELVNVMKSQNEENERLVSDLRMDVQSLNVKLDESNNRLTALYEKVEEQITQAESRTLPTFSDPGGPKPDQVYSLAFNDYLAGNYELAINAFRDFLINYPESEYADNAAYYLGLCYQQQGRPDQAIQAFDEVINLWPNADMTPVAYFKKGSTELELQRNEAAISTFRKLIQLFPDSQEASVARQELTTLGIDPEGP
jgi:tol-pal system protein YbgF